ncbi:ovate family protein 1, ARABIDOPSIS THALIANA OVATE FAMILY PROTEIN 1 [Hibiscus trionum]|uniref:Transcription repressor n=1 Tax=Hibiscus trionum TaxID=183268 RepID=A0A9W7IT78_HIBTR|nr:ovate family protein 1, ARABIDOPSIS THALIANA OVATE FAMILY PROTEIN 1 [Hibiscus trionum]
MGNYRFKFSDIIPNAWLYKLKNMGRPKNTDPSKSKQQQLHPFNSRKSYYFSRDLVPLDDLPPRKSSKKPCYSRRRNFRSSPPPPSTVITSSISTGCSCRDTVWSKADSPPDYSASSSSSDDSSPLESSDADVKKTDELPELQVPPITTKPVKFNDMIKDIKKKHKKDKNSNPVKKLGVSSSSGVRLRTHSPRIGSRRLVQGHARKSVSSSSSSSSLSESLAVVKSSFDPQRDFWESMVEMILENNIRTSKELEELLACYLSLNSDEYHEVIIKVFKQIWFDLNDVHFK